MLQQLSMPPTIPSHNYNNPNEEIEFWRRNGCILLIAQIPNVPKLNHFYVLTSILFVNQMYYKSYRWTKGFRLAQNPWTEN